ncbi:MAG: Txe/YoeB family addiction module toxin [Eggerthellaceae bacterium]|nr:Txe/YoeB family addiction module toxin [Eggerthellaceae bacterium]
MYQVVFSKQAAKDAKKLKAAGLDAKAKQLVSIVREDPFAYPPAYEPLVGSLTGMYSRRINRQHRFVYEVIKTREERDLEYEGVVKVLSMWTHYETI